MKTIGLIGGKLQGFEVAYLAKKAGMKVVLIDRNPEALSRKMADEFHCFDVILEPEKLIELSKWVDAFIPVNENLETINFLNRIKEKLFAPFLFDFDAYEISRDKKKSKEYFASIGTPTPLDKPLKPPYFVKPPCESSSIGTSIIYDDEGLKNLDSSMLIEEYVEGDVVSLEVVGDGIHFAVVKETKIHIDDTYDCYRVTPLPYDSRFREISHSLAANLSLKGIMDVEAIAGPTGLKVIEIDARFPSQTPTAVYYSSGINLIELLCQAFSGGVSETLAFPLNNYCIYEHLLLKEGKLVPVGEQLLSGCNEYVKYHEEPGLEVYKCSGRHTVFTMISWAQDEAKAEAMRAKGFSLLARAFDLVL